MDVNESGMKNEKDDGESRSGYIMHGEREAG
jgi:hypothetical protein